MNRNKKYTTEEERIAARREHNRKWNEDNKEKMSEYIKQWREANKEKISEYNKKYYEANKDTMLEWQKKYNKTPIGRANNLIRSYRQSDKLYNRGECTLTAQWIVDNIFTSKCRYCGKDDWTELGCDRINNDLPHTPDNVVCSCEECNKKRGRKTFEEFLSEST